MRAKLISARELTSHALARIDALNPQVNVFVAVDGERALAEAAAIDERIARGDDPGPLAGIPIGVKDLEDAEGFVTTHGSPLHADDAPAAGDSILVARLKAKGCVVLGKTNTPEFGWKGDTQNEVFGATRNPWDLARSAGGSSGGTGAALAAGMVPLATGSDGGGSIRIPSAINGLSGLKPSLGRVPFWWRVATGLGRALDEGPDGSADPRCRVRGRVRGRSRPNRPLVAADARRAVVTRAERPRRAAEGRRGRRRSGTRRSTSRCSMCASGAVRVLEGLGTEVVELPVVFDEDPIRHFLTDRERRHARRGRLPYRGSPAFERIDPGLAQSIEWAEGNVTAVAFKQAQDACHLLNLKLVAALRGVSFLITPATAAVTPLQGEVGVINGNPDANWVRFTYPFNLTRSPAGVVNAGYSATGLPIGLQVIGPQHADVGVLRLLAVLEDHLADDRLAPVA